MKDLLKKLENKGLTLGSVESFTGGLFATELTDISGASRVFRGSIVAYHNELKQDLLKITSELIEKHGVVSDVCALELAIQGLSLLKCSICVSFTGNAGPDVLENKAVGLYYIAVASSVKTKVYEFNSVLSRNDLRHEAVLQAIQCITLDFLG